jgi:hypothetical protein
MNKYFLASAIFLSLIFVNSVQAQTSNNQLPATELNKILSGYIGGIGKTVSDNFRLYRPMEPEWENNSEVTEIRSYSNAKRLAAIYLLLDLQDKHEAKAFPNIHKDPNHFLLRLATRLPVLVLYNSLLSDLPNNIVIKDYIQSESSDIKLALNLHGTMNMFLQNQQNRKSKMTMLLFSNEEIVKEALELKVNGMASIDILAVKSFMTILTRFCQPDMGGSACLDDARSR